MLVSILLASALSIPPLPPAEYDDTEVAVNVPLPAIFRQEHPDDDTYAIGESWDVA